MELVIPGFRDRTVKLWEEIFVEKEPTELFHVNIHGTSFKFNITNPELLKKLKAFFPLSWQSPSTQSIFVKWRGPDKKLLGSSKWDDVVDPNCRFHGDFISQRDFLAKKINSQNYEVISFEKIDDGLFNFLRYLLPLSLLSDDKVLFHSSCVVNSDNEAFLFFGPSGAGKTTVASLCQEQGGNVLGDDMNILSFTSEGVRVEGAAVGQRIYDKNNFGKTFKIKKAFWLKQSNTFEHTLFSEGQVKYYLSSFANFFWDQLSRSQYEKIFKLVGDINQSMPLYELSFSKTNEVWNYVQSIK